MRVYSKRKRTVEFEVRLGLDDIWRLIGERPPSDTGWVSATFRTANSPLSIGSEVDAGTIIVKYECDDPC